MSMITPIIESKVLALLARDKEFGVSVLPYLTEEMFTQPQHRLFFRFVKEFYDQYKVAPTAESLTHAVRVSGLSIERDQLRALGEFVFSVYSNGLPEDTGYIKDQVSGFVKVAAMRTFLSEAGMMVEEGNVEDIVKRFEDARLAGTSVAEVPEELYAGFDARIIERNSSVSQKRYPTGFPTIDFYLNGGLGEGELGVIMAPTNVGKSQVLGNIAANLTRARKRNLLITLELPRLEVFNRMESNLSGIPIDGLLLHSDKLQAMKQELFQKYAGYFYVLEYPTKSINIDTINAIIKRFQITIGKLDVVLLDYVDLLKVDKHRELRHELEESYAKLRGFGGENKVGIWTATQANRQAYKEERTESHHASEAIGKVQIADIVLTLNQTEEEYNKGKLRLFLDKNRRGKKWFEIPFLTLFERGQMKELEQATRAEAEGLQMTDIDSAVTRMGQAKAEKEQLPTVPDISDSATSPKPVNDQKNLRKDLGL